MFEKERDAVIAKYSKHWELLDAAHRIEHFDSVFETALLIMSRSSPMADPQEVFVVAYFHDLFTWSRSNHHLLSETFIRTTNCTLVTSMLDTPEAVDRVALACREHRASWTGGFSSDLSRLMSAADRGIPKSAETLLERARLFAATHNPSFSLDEVNATAVGHIKEKYGRNGYAKIPASHREMFAQEYELLYDEIDRL